MKTSLFSILFFSFSFIVNGQTDFLDGAYINQKNDTITGKIKRYFDESKDAILFKKQMEGEVKTLFADEIYSYQINNYTEYYSNKVNVGQDSVFVFLEKVIDGEVCFYKFIDNTLKERYFIQSKFVKGLRELKYEEVFKMYEKEGKRLKEKHRFYIGELLIAFQDCPKMAQKVNHSDFTETDFVDLIIDYNECVGSDYKLFVNQKNGNKAKVEIVVFTGINRIGYKPEFDGLNILFGRNIGGSLILFPKTSFGRYSVDFTFINSRVNFEEKLSENRDDIIYNHLKILYSGYFTSDNHRLSYSVGPDFGYAIRPKFGFSAGVGFDYKVGNNYITTDFQYRFINGRLLNFNLGFAF